MGEPDGLVKIVAERDGPLLGVHIVGPWATELLAEGYLAVNWEATRRRPRRADPPAPDAERAVRRVRARAHRPLPARLTGRTAQWTSRCRSSARRSPRARSPGGSSRWATRSRVDEPLFEVSTDKVDSEVPSPAAGVLTEIVVPEGDTVEVGARLAVLGDGDAAPAPRRAAGRRGRARAAPERRAGARAARPRPPPAPAPPPPPAARAAAAAPRPPPAPPAAAARRRPRRRPATAPGRRPGHVAGRAAPHRRARARPGVDHRHRRGRPHHPARRDERVAPRRRRAAGTAPRPPAAQLRAAPAPAAARRATGDEIDPVRQHPPPHRRAHGPLEGDERARVHVGRGRLRARRAGPRRRTRRAWQARGGLLAHLPAVHRPRVLRRGARLPERQRERRRRRRSSCTTTSTSAIAVDLDFKGLIAPVIRDADGKRLRLIAREIRDLATRARIEAARARTRSSAARSRSRTWARSARYMTLPIINQPQVAILATDAITQAAGRGRGSRRRRRDRDPPGRRARARVGPPGVRRRVRGVVPPRGARDPRDTATGNAELA